MIFRMLLEKELTGWFGEYLQQPQLLLKVFD